MIANLYEDYPTMRASAKPHIFTEVSDEQLHSTQHRKGLKSACGDLFSHACNAVRDLQLLRDGG